MRDSWQQTDNILLDCDQSNYYSSHIVFPAYLAIGQTENSAIRSVDPENPTVEPNMKWIGQPLAEIYGHLKFSQMWGRSSVGPIYISYTDLIYSSSLR